LQEGDIKQATSATLVAPYPVATSGNSRSKECGNGLDIVEPSLDKKHSTAMAEKNEDSHTREYSNNPSAYVFLADKSVGPPPPAKVH